MSPTKIVTGIDIKHLRKLQEGEVVLLPAKKCCLPTGAQITFRERYNNRNTVEARIVQCWRWWMVKLVPVTSS